MKIKIVTNRVAATWSASYNNDMKPLNVFFIAFWLEIPDTACTLQPIGDNLLKCDINAVGGGTRAPLTIGYPVLDVGSTFPDGAVEPLDCGISGSAVLRLQNNEYRVELGSINCLLNWTNPNANSSLAAMLSRLWPQQLPGNSVWQFHFLPDGFAMTAPFQTSPAQAAADIPAVTLLLPALSATQLDIEWTQYTTAWAWQDTADMSGIVSPPNDTPLKLDFARDHTGDKAWGDDGYWIARCWRLIDTQRNPDPTMKSEAARLLDRLYVPPWKDPRTQLNRIATDVYVNSVNLPADQALPPYARIVELSDLGGPHHKIVQLRCLVFDLLRGYLNANLNWENGRQSSFRAEYSRVGVAFDANGAIRSAPEFLTLRSGQPGKDPVTGTWNSNDSHLGVSLKQATFLYAGLSGSSAQSAFDTTQQPSHLFLRDGSLQLPALPVEGMAAGKEASAADFMESVAASDPLLHGGMPLAGTNVLPDLIAWAPRDQDASLELKMSATQTQLSIWNPVLTWRTPSWWLRCDDYVVDGELQPYNGSGWERFVDAFENQFGDVSASDFDQANALSGTLSTLLCSTFWVGSTTLDAATGWTLHINDGTNQLDLPQNAAYQAWVNIANAGLVNTRPSSQAPAASILLDPARSLTQLQGLSDQIKLVADLNCLPRFQSPLYLHVEAAALAGKGTRSAEEMFHPNIPGLAYVPSTAKFTMRHGLPILAGAELSARLDGFYDDAAASAPLDTVRAANDVALISLSAGGAHDGFTIDKDGNVQGANLAIQGWLPSGNVPVIKANISAGILGSGANPPGLTLTIGGKTGADQYTVTVGSGNNGFDPGLGIGSDAAGNTFWLEPAGPDGLRALRNFGQPLLKLDAAPSTFVDGANRRWQAFDSRGRMVTDAAGAAAKHWSFMARFPLSAGPNTSPATLGLSVQDIAAGTAAAKPAGWNSGTWDLASDDAGAQMAQVGPFLIVPIDLQALADTSIAATVSISPPFASPTQIQNMNGNRTGLKLDLAGAAWNPGIDPHANTFQWQYEAGPTMLQVLGMRGTVAIDTGALLCTLTSLTLSSPLGPLQFDVAPAPITVTQDASKNLFLSCTVAAVANGEGFTASATLLCSGNGIWQVIKPQLQWQDDKQCQVSITDTGGVNIQNLVLHPAVPKLSLVGPELHQSSSDSWVCVAVDTPRLGPPTRQSFITFNLSSGNRAPRLALGWRATALLNQLPLVFGPCIAGSVRADLHGAFSFNTKRLTFASASSLTGWIEVQNVFGYQISGGGAQFSHTAGVAFWELGLSLDGTIGKLDGVPAFDAIVTHKIRSGNALITNFQAAQRLFLRLDGAGAAQGLESRALLALRKQDSDDVIVPLVQIQFGDNENLALARLPERYLDPATALLRVPLRTGITPPILLIVPNGAAAPPGLAWRPHVTPPKLPNDDSVRANDQDCWHWRGALAKKIAPPSLKPIAMLASPLQGNYFGDKGNQPFPSAGELASDWGWLLSGAGAGTLMAGYYRPSDAPDQDDRLTPNAGVTAMPFYLQLGTGQAPDKAADSLQVALFAPALAGSNQGPFRQVATAMVQIPDGLDQAAGTIQAWAGTEALRLSLRCVVVAVARGGKVVPQLVSRSFEAAAVGDLAAPPGLPTRGQFAPVSALRGWQGASAVNGNWTYLLRVRSDAECVLEIPLSQPVCEDASPSNRYSHLALSMPAVVPGPFKYSLGIQASRSLDFAVTGAAAGPVQWPTWKSSVASSAPWKATPLEVDIWHSVLRPGDQCTTVFKTADGSGMEGPPLTMKLREARAKDMKTDPQLQLLKPVKCTVDGVTWRIHRATINTPVGTPNKPATMPWLTLVSPWDTRHLPLVGNAPAPLPRLQLACNLDASGAPTGTAPELRDPLLLGVFDAAPPQTENRWIGIAKHGAPQNNQLPSDNVGDISSILQSPSLLTSWQKQKITVLSFGPLKSNRVGSDPNSPVFYTLTEGAQLKLLLEKTPANHWIFAVDAPNTPAAAQNAPIFVWGTVQTTATGSTIFTLISSLANLVWRKSDAIEPPEQLMISTNDQVLGFGDAAGRSTLFLDSAARKFILSRMSLGVERVETTSPPSATVCHFSSSGACLGFLTNPYAKDV